MQLCTTMHTGYMLELRKLHAQLPINVIIVPYKFAICVCLLSSAKRMLYQIPSTNTEIPSRLEPTERALAVHECGGHTTIYPSTHYLTHTIYTYIQRHEYIRTYLYAEKVDGCTWTWM